jgi:hypothetical protein
MGRNTGEDFGFVHEPYAELWTICKWCVVVFGWRRKQRGDCSGLEWLRMRRWVGRGEHSPPRENEKTWVLLTVDSCQSVTKPLFDSHRD